MASSESANGRMDPDLDARDNGSKFSRRERTDAQEGAQVQHLAATLGGAREYGPGVLALQWKRRNWIGKAKELGLLSAVD